VPGKDEIGPQFHHSPGKRIFIMLLLEYTRINQKISYMPLYMFVLFA